MICHQEWVVRPSPLWAMWRWVAGVFSQLEGPSSCSREGHGQHKSHSKAAAHDLWSQAILRIKPFYGASGVGSWILWQAARITGLGLPKYKVFHHPFENRKWEANHTLTFQTQHQNPNSHHCIRIEKCISQIFMQGLEALLTLTDVLTTKENTIKRCHRFFARGASHPEIRRFQGHLKKLFTKLIKSSAPVHCYRKI